MISAPHVNNDRLHANDDRLHAHKAPDFFLNIQSRRPFFLLQPILKRLSFSKMQSYSPFSISLKQHFFISCRYHISVYQQKRKNSIKISN